MSIHVLGAMAREGFEEVLAFQDAESGLRAFVALHDTSAGPAFGGIRRHVYPDETAALSDCLRLALAMAFKCALAGVPGGGAKAVLLDGPRVDLPLAYHRLGERVEALRGRFYTGPDVGTGERELAWVCEATRYATRPGDGGPGDLAGATAIGAFEGIAAGLRALDGEELWERRTVVVQGLGEVGRRLSSMLLEEGVRVLGAEVRAERAEAARAELGIEVLEVGSEVEARCDVFAPCAMGGVLHDVTIRRLGARIVAGPANNVLARTRHADLLHERGVLHVPDVAMNAGALIRGARFHVEGVSAPDEEVRARTRAVTESVLAEAAERDEPPLRTALREARGRIRERRAHARDEAAPGVSLARPDGAKA